LLAFVVFSLTMGFSTILTYAFPSAVFYVDMAHYPIILRMLANAAEFLVILLAVLLVGEIYLRASLSLIRRKMAA
jgi:hypothetical protein